MLTAAAATRWLNDNKLKNMARVTYSQYKAISYKLTDGKNPDILEVLGDLQNFWAKDSIISAQLPLLICVPTILASITTSLTKAKNIGSIQFKNLLNSDKIPKKNPSLNQW